MRQTDIPVSESSQIGEARRAAVRIAELAGFGENEQGKIAIVATEVATNLVRHARDGHLLIQVIPRSSGKALEIVAIDAGPGMANVERCLQDGYSTGGTNGTGLGAIKRLSSEFDIHSIPDRGTALLSRIFSDTAPVASRPNFIIGAASFPVAGEIVCGDGWASSETENELRLMVADGLGHGPLAQAASNAAEQVFRSQPNAADPKSLVEASHRALSGTRGAALAVAQLDLQSRRLKYAGVGNIAGSLVTSTGTQGLVSHNGIVGVKMQKVQQFEHPIEGTGLLIMHSDGLKSRWDLMDHPGLTTRHPAIIASVLYRDYRRERDDVTVVVIRFGSNRV